MEGNRMIVSAVEASIAVEAWVRPGVVVPDGTIPGRGLIDWVSHFPLSAKGGILFVQHLLEHVAHLRRLLLVALTDGIDNSLVSEIERRWISQAGDGVSNRKAGNLVRLDFFLGFIYALAALRQSDALTRGVFIRFFGDNFITDFVSDRQGLRHSWLGVAPRLIVR